jgi:hypothetical protein
MAGFVPAQEFIAFLLMPMMFLGCTFFSYAMLPDPWNIVALLLPTTYLRNAHKITSSSALMNFRRRCEFIRTVRINPHLQLSDLFHASSLAKLCALLTVVNPPFSSGNDLRRRSLRVTVAIHDVLWQPGSVEK